jgi:hypothetical protein
MSLHRNKTKTLSTLLSLPLPSLSILPTPLLTELMKRRRASEHPLEAVENLGLDRRLLLVSVDVEGADLTGGTGGRGSAEGTDEPRTSCVKSWGRGKGKGGGEGWRREERRVGGGRGAC